MSKFDGPKLEVALMTFVNADTPETRRLPAAKVESLRLDKQRELVRVLMERYMADSLRVSSLEIRRLDRRIKELQLGIEANEVTSG
jgi:hypothetical protein